MIYNNILETVGHTPMVRLDPLAAAAGVQAELLAKVESFNPAGSAKDRVAAAMVAAAEAAGQLRPGGVIVEPTSGNTGVGLALVAAVKGYRVILTMPETMSVERRRLLAAYGAEIVLTPGAEGMKGAIDRAEELQRSLPGAFIPQQFSNPANPAVHESATGREIWEDCGGRVDVFVAGVGTGGTLSGTGRALKRHNPQVHVVAVEPASSQVLAGGEAGPHGLQGIGANFVPANFDRSVADEILPVSDDEAYRTGRLLARRCGILAGITSGAAVAAALQVARRPAFAQKRIVVLLPDTGERYLSTPLFA